MPELAPPDADDAMDAERDRLSDGQEGSGPWWNQSYIILAAVWAGVIVFGLMITFAKLF